MSNYSFRPTRVVTGPKTRLTYLHVWEPFARNGGEPKYSACILIPKDDTETLDKIQAAIEAAYEEGKEKLKGSARMCPPLAALKTPLRDGDMERPGDDVYAGHYFMNASGKRQPNLIGPDMKVTEDQNVIYSGMYGRASINFYAYSASGNRGIACGLNGIMKTEDGPRLGGGGSPAADFENLF